MEDDEKSLSGLLEEDQKWAAEKRKESEAKQCLLQLTPDTITTHLVKGA